MIPTSKRGTRANRSSVASSTRASYSSAGIRCRPSPHPASRATSPVAPSAAITKAAVTGPVLVRSEEHTPELQSRLHLVCRLLLENTESKLSLSLALPYTHTDQYSSLSPCHSLAFRPSPASSVRPIPHS